MGDFNHGHIQWTSLQSTGREDQEFLNLVQDSFLSQHVLEATRGKNVLDIVLSSQKEFVDNVKICEPLGCSDHNQIHFIIKVKGERNRKIRYRNKFHKGRYKDMREYLAKIDWNNTLKNKTATECWNILKSEFSFSQRTVNEWNRLSWPTSHTASCGHCVSGDHWSRYIRGYDITHPLSCQY